jgi:hypothetical protein
MLNDTRKPIGWSLKPSSAGLLLALVGMLGLLRLLLPGHAFSWWELGSSLVVAVGGGFQWWSGRHVGTVPPE